MSIKTHNTSDDHTTNLPPPHLAGLLSDDQCKARDARRKARQKVQRSNSGVADQSDETCGSVDSMIKTEVASPPLACDPLELLSIDQRELLEKIVLYQDEFELPNEEDVKRVSVSGFK